ncbi:MAG: ketol-acid reductoisomerase, partial [Candidatus Omnitrophota bacterium]
MAKIYYDSDADIELLKERVISIIGYGVQGRGQAVCLRDSGCKVIVSELAGTPAFEQAKKDGFEPISAFEAAKQAD